MIVLMMGLFSVSVQAKDPHDFDLLHWCKKRSKAYFTSKNIAPYNWRAERVTAGESLLVHGIWRASNIEQSVNCRVLKGAPRRFAVIEIPAQNYSEPVSESKRIISSERVLRQWCKFKSAQYFLQQGDAKLYNWVILPARRSDKLVVTGQWSVNDSKQIVQCAIYKGAAEQNASMELK